MSTEVFEMDPEETLDFEIEFVRSLESGEEIADASWEVSGNATIGADDYAPTNTATRAKVWISGAGEAGEESIVTCTMKTDATPPRIFRESFGVKMVTR